jgi:hypothetical protein
MPGTHEGKAFLKDLLYRPDEDDSSFETMPYDPSKDDAGFEQLPYKTAGLMPEDDMLLKSLLKGEIGPLTDPRIRKAIDDLQKQKYGYNKGRA